MPGLDMKEILTTATTIFVVDSVIYPQFGRPGMEMIKFLLEGAIVNYAKDAIKCSCDEGSPGMNSLFQEGWLKSSILIAITLYATDRLFKIGEFTGAGPAMNAMKFLLQAVVIDVVDDNMGSMYSA